MELAAAITAFLAPFLPHLLKIGQPVAEAAGKKLGEKFGEGASVDRKLSRKGVGSG